MLGLAILGAGILLGASATTRAGDDPRADDARLKAEARAVVDRYARDFDAYVQALRQARTAEEREEAVARRPGPVPGAAELVGWAERNPREPGARDLLATVARHGRFTADAQRAAALLARDHLDLGGTAFEETALQVLVWPMPVAEAWLRDYLDGSPDRAVRARACLELALYKKWLVERAAQEMDAGWISQLEENFGTGSTDYLRELDRDRLADEAIALLERLVGEFGDVEWSGGRLADAARPHLLELTKLAVGKQAPEIAADDLDGERFRLTESRGKVVVLTFWATWCGPCMAQIPHERALVERFAARPFALLGINGDQDAAAAARAVREHRINWRSWRDDRGKGEPISANWNVRSWPTSYVIDHRGIIRHRNLKGPELAAAVERLLQEAEADAKGK